VKKKEKAIYYCQKSKKSPFLSKICVKYFDHKTKRALLKTFCSRRKSCFFCIQKRKRTTQLYVDSIDFKKQWQKFANFVLTQTLIVPKNKRENTFLWEKNKRVFCCYLLQSCFLIQVTKMKEAKNKQTTSEVLFLFVKTTILLCKKTKRFFVSQLFKKTTVGFKKKQLFFLP